MNLDLTAEEQAFREEARTWLRENLPDEERPPEGAEMREFDLAWQRTLFEGGWAGINWPTEYGGRGLSDIQQMIWYEEFASADPPFTLNNSCTFVGNNHGGPTLMARGSDTQKAEHLPRILRGEVVWCQGFSEPGAGSDLAGLSTKAVVDGDELVVTGQKTWTSYAHVADLQELLVRTDPDAPKHKGISWLILDMHQPGVEVRPMRTIDGESHFCEVFLTDARVPVENRVGAENDGWRVTNVTLRFERGTAFAQHIINLRTQLRRLVRMARSVPTDAGSAWDDPSLQMRVGHLEAGVEALWRMTQKGIADAEATGMPAPSGSAVKLRFSELSQELGELAVEVLGPLALAGVRIDGIDGVEVAREYLWSLQYTIAAGTSQIQRNLIAERVLGLPRGR